MNKRRNKAGMMNKTYMCRKTTLYLSHDAFSWNDNMYAAGVEWSSSAFSILALFLYYFYM